MVGAVKDWFAKGAATYDESEGFMFEPATIERTVDVLQELADGGRALELAIGTGRIGLPLARRGVEVHGIDLSGPMVGVFYRSPEPGAEPFVEVGDTVAAGQTLCLLEAMKLFNELKADAAGVVRGIHADNAQAVEYGQLLFELEPVVGIPLDAV